MTGLTTRSRTLVMGIVNVTPDSFSDGGLWADPEQAIAQGLRLVEEGADIIDVGGESTRPGAARPPMGQELDRVLPVISALVAEGVVVSVDTMRAEVASQAVEAGAAIINDVSGGLADHDMLGALTGCEATYVAMHWRAHSAQMRDHATYDGPGGVLAAVCDELSARLAAMADAGIDLDRVVLDPGLGFAKRPEHDWELLRGLDRLQALGRPLLIGASRKSFLGRLLGPPEAPRPAPERDAATAALTTWVAMADTPVWGVRVHDARSSRDALTVLDRLREGDDDDVEGKEDDR